MRVSFDLHLHSCLSPCGDEEMSPANIVNMAALLGLDIIALTDHNSAGNCRSALTAGARAGVLALPGMELCTSEEIHVICLFDELEKAEAFGKYVASTLPPVVNRPDIFGRQLYMDDRDEILGEEPTLLITASSVSIQNVAALVEGYGGFCYPAHIDRSSYSILSSLGDFPPQLGFSLAEITGKGDEAALTDAVPALSGLRFLRSSDAHSLSDMENSCESRFMDIPQKTGAAVLDWLRAAKNRGTDGV